MIASEAVLDVPTYQKQNLVESWRWPLWAVGTGVFGAIGHLFSEGRLTDEERLSGAGVIAALDHTRFQIGIVAGLIAIFSLLCFTAGWSRWVQSVAAQSLAARVVGLALTASAGAMIIGYGFKGSLAVYLQGGMDEGTYPAENLLVIFMINDFAPFMSWWGVAMAAAAIAWLAIKEKFLPLWLGIVSAIFVLIPVAFVVATGLPGFPGVIDPLWMIIFGIALAVIKRKEEAGRGIGE